MIKIKIENKDVVLVNIESSRFRWAFILSENGIVQYAKVIPPEAEEYGAAITLDNLSEEDVNKYSPKTYINNNQDLTRRITDVQEAVSRSYGFNDPTQAQIWNSMTFRTKIMKQHLRINGDDEYSKEDEIKSNIACGEVSLNFALRPIKIKFNAQNAVQAPAGEVNQESNIVINENQDKNLNITKPKIKFEG